MKIDFEVFHSAYDAARVAAARGLESPAAFAPLVLYRSETIGEIRKKVAVVSDLRLQRDTAAVRPPAATENLIALLEMSIAHDCLRQGIDAEDAESFRAWEGAMQLRDLIARGDRLN